MNYKTQSIITISVVVAIMIAVAILINSMDLGVTGSAVDCSCKEDAGCDDHDACTQDICLYKESCAAARCIHKTIENCNR